MWPIQYLFLKRKTKQLKETNSKKMSQMLDLAYFKAGLQSMYGSATWVPLIMANLATITSGAQTVNSREQLSPWYDSSP